MLHSVNIRHIICAAALAISLNCPAQVKTGLEVLREDNFSCLKGKKVGLLTNPTGVDSGLESTIDILFNAPEVNLVALFAPEHGVRGDVYAGEKVCADRDEKTGLPVHSLYGATRQPTPEMLSDIDVLVYDIQDNGCRSYTFISTLGLAMRSCAEEGKSVVVLDRPNPLGGLKVEGALREVQWSSFVGQYAIPYIYGLTVGELALMINGEGLNCGQKGNEKPLVCDLTVIPMKGWRREMKFADTGLPWVPTSPNIPCEKSALCYPASGLCGELYGYLQIGIGYTLPFEVFAAEWLDADKLKSTLDSYKIPGTAWRVIHYKPFSGACKGKTVHGVQFFFTDFEAAPVTLLQFYVMQAVFELYGKNPFPEGDNRLPMFCKVCGTDYVLNTFGATMKVSSIENFWNKDKETFRNMSKKYYLYQ